MNKEILKKSVLKYFTNVPSRDKNEFEKTMRPFVDSRSWVDEGTYKYRIQEFIMSHTESLEEALKATQAIQVIYDEDEEIREKIIFNNFFSRFYK